MITKLIAWWKRYFTKENPPATFFYWLENKKEEAPAILNWSGEIEDQWSVEEGPSSWMMDLECGYPRSNKEQK